MKKLLTTLALFAGLVLGSLTLAPAATAADCAPGSTDPICSTPAPTPVDCKDPIRSKDPICARQAVLEAELFKADQTANDYRAQVIALTDKVDHLQRVADRRAATIQRLRAVIRALR